MAMGPRSGRTPHQVLGVDPGAGPDEIKRAYRRIVLKYHPDRNPGDAAAQQRFDEVNRAYRQLTAPAADSAPPSQPDFEEIFANFGDLFGDLFGFHRPKCGADIQIPLQLTQLQVWAGGAHRVAYVKKVRCRDCADTTSACASCNGTGRTGVQLGDHLIGTTCEACRGKGRQGSCSTCDGSGLVAENTFADIPVPTDVVDETLLKLDGAGEEALSPDQPNGHLYVMVTVESDPRIWKDGSDIHIRVPIAPELARRGGDVEVETISGNLTVSAPAGTRSGDTRRLQGFGVSHPGAARMPPPSAPSGPFRSADTSGRGDMIIHWVAQSPARRLLAVSRRIRDNPTTTVLAIGTALLLWLLW